MKQLTFALLLTLFAGISHAQAQSQIYVGTNLGTVAEYSGTGTLITNPAISSNNASFSTLALGNNTIYTSDDYNDRIGNYRLGGSTINANLIQTTGGNPQDVVVSGSDLFVANYSGISEYSTSGVLIKQNLVSGLASAGDFAIYNGDIYVINNAGYTYSTMEEFDLSGNLVNSSFISNLPDTFHMVIANGYIYTASYANGSISQYYTSGAPANLNFISGLGDAGVADFTIYGNQLYLTDDNTDKVLEYDATTGAQLSSSLITLPNGDFPTSIAVVPEPGTAALALLGTLALAGFAARRKLRA